MLAGVIRGPSLLNPFRSMENAKDIQAEVLDRLVASELVTRADAEAAKGQAISLRPPAMRLATGSYPLQSVFDLLEDYLAPHLIENGGLRIYTTIDEQLQKVAQTELNRHLTTIEQKPGYPHAPRSSHKDGAATKYLQGSVVTLDNRTGGEDDVGTLVEMLAGNGQTADKQMEVEEAREWVRSAVDNLPESLKSALMLVYHQGMKYREAADVLGIPVGTVKSRLHSALLKLNESWQRSGRAVPEAMEDGA
jgi:RNA polymerase sigma factor (sigma-70 family)